jgi:hypothetical protein
LTRKWGKALITTVAWIILWPGIERIVGIVGIIGIVRTL